MLDILLLASTSLSPTSPLRNEVISVAVSNVDGVTPNPLWQQMNRTDEDVDLGLSDDELELIAGELPKCRLSETNNCLVSNSSDVVVNGKKIINFNDFPYNKDQHQQIDYIMGAFANATPPIPISRQTAGIISNHLRATAPILTKRAHCGFTIELPTNLTTTVDARFIGCP